MVSAAVVLFAAVVSLRRAKAKAEVDAALDQLTGLPNRRSCHDSLGLLYARALRSRSMLAVISFDIDLFKDINDLYGHERGDVVLATLGACLDDWIRFGDVGARVGGEEFLVLLPDTPLDGALIVAERIRCGVEELSIETGGPLTVSLGVALLEPPESAADLLRRADAALYAAKSQGRNRVVSATAPVA